MGTPHISAMKGDFAKTVLMPGDPLRAKYIADTYLEDVSLVTSVRNMLGFTGSYKGKKISVMGSGMGIPSISIYAKELYTDYDVDNIIRVGSCGGIADDVKIRDLIVASGASTDSNVNRMRMPDIYFSAIPDFYLLRDCVNKAEEMNLPVRVGNMVSADLFYNPNEGFVAQARKFNLLAVEMEAAGLYGVAAEYGKASLCICTVSDHIVTGESLSAEDRQNSFHDMMELALNTIK